MDEIARLLTLLALVGGALAVWGGLFVWAFNEPRRIHKALTTALGAGPQMFLAARGRGRAIGMDEATTALAVVWDTGAWTLTYRAEELLGAELIVDRWVVARAHRGEVRRPLDQLAPPQERVRLRLLFDDPTYPDFDMDLWRPEDVGARGRFDADTALHEANRWLARLESLMRRNLGVRVGPAQVVAVAPPPLTLVRDDEAEDDAPEPRRAIS